MVQQQFNFPASPNLAKKILGEDGGRQLDGHELGGGRFMNTSCVHVSAEVEILTGGYGEGYFFPTWVAV
jgi:hypothetical protein